MINQSKRNRDRIELIFELIRPLRDIFRPYPDLFNIILCYIIINYCLLSRCLTGFNSVLLIANVLLNLHLITHYFRILIVRFFFMKARGGPTALPA